EPIGRRGTPATGLAEAAKPGVVPAGLSSGPEDDQETPHGESSPARFQPQAARSLGRPCRGRELAREGDARPAAHRGPAGRDDPQYHPRPAVRGEVEEGLLRTARPRLAHRTGGLRRLGQPRVLRRCAVRSTSAAGRRLPLRQDPHAGRGPCTRNPRMDRAGGQAPRLALIARPDRSSGRPSTQADRDHRESTRLRTGPPAIPAAVRSRGVQATVRGGRWRPRRRWRAAACRRSTLHMTRTVPATPYITPPRGGG